MVAPGVLPLGAGNAEELSESLLRNGFANIMYDSLSQHVGYRLGKGEFVKLLTSESPELVQKVLETVEDLTFLERLRGATHLPFPYTSLVQTHARIYKDSFGYLSDFRATSHFVKPLPNQTSLTFYIAPDGNDADSGLSQDAPKQSLHNLVSDLNASNTNRWPVTIYCAPGWYHNAVGFSNTSCDFPVNIIRSSTEDQAWFVQSKSMTVPENKHATYTNCYLCVMESNTGVFVIDKKYFDIEGNPIRYKNVSTVVDANNTPGSMNHSNSTNILIHTIDGRRPDSDIILVTLSPNWKQVHSHDIFASGIALIGGNSPFNHNVSGASKIVFSDARFLYGRNGNGTTIETGNHTAIFNRSVSGLNTADGFSCRGSVLMIELDCTGYGNGFGTVPGSDNGSTIHSSAKSIRLNCKYYGNKDRQVHDVGNVQSWLIATEAGEGRTTGTTEYENAAFAFGHPEDALASKATLLDCRSLGNCVSDLVLCNQNVQVAYSQTNLRTPYLMGSPQPIATAIPRY